MRIEVDRSGGFAGIRRHGVLETKDHPESGRLENLARAALAAPEASGRPVPDGFHYDVTVDGKEFTCADPWLTAAQRELITAVLGEGA